MMLSSVGGGGPRLSSAALQVGLVAPSDIPYCGEVVESPEPIQFFGGGSSFQASSSSQSHAIRVFNILLFSILSRN